MSASGKGGALQKAEGRRRVELDDDDTTARSLNQQRHQRTRHPLPDSEKSDTRRRRSATRPIRRHSSGAGEAGGAGQAGKGRWVNAEESPTCRTALPAPPALPALSSHQFPELRHGPASMNDRPARKAATICRHAHGRGRRLITTRGDGMAASAHCRGQVGLVGRVEAGGLKT